MQFRIGYEPEFECVDPTPIILHLAVHPSRAADLHEQDRLETEPSLRLRAYRDDFGNSCHRAVLPPGRTRLHARGLIHDSGRRDRPDRGPCGRRPSTSCRPGR